MRDLFFCPERWEPDSEVTSNIVSHSEVQGFAGTLTEAWQLGDWDYHWTAIVSTIPVEAGWLESGSEYRFCFWLNGGENTTRDEVCELEIFGDSWEDRLTFRLNRDYTKPILEKNGWLLFGIPFTAPKASAALTFRFVAAGAVCTVAGIPDMDMAKCEALTPDERDLNKPQRHNIALPGGFPHDPSDTVTVTMPRGRKLSLSKTALRIGAAAGALVITALVAHKIKNKHN